MDTKQLKLMTLEEAVSRIEDGMVLGIGTGSTIELLVPGIGKLVNDKGYKLTGVCTSKRTESQATALNIPVIHVNDATHIDLAIDGADEIDPQLNLIKGGGAALFREKVIDEMAEQFVVLADETKIVDYLGQTFKLPVEVDCFNWRLVMRHIEGYIKGEVSLRMADEQPLITDNGNYILDVHLTEKVDPYEFHEFLIHLTGVLETGYFLDLATEAIVGTQLGVKILQR
ncbi:MULTISPECIES: ribose 5-phosphate isomerase A [unclassified Staphylococcus]|uniref:ribose 5-phosphate isomerase A n=1 Tax=unclassified Staphylococcus TaxID=91994 RepID=UPI0021D34E78|nr:MULTISPECIES: ribose 5-phosphate isomerase A [unclassified Staphylococcus]UXR71392.1 ribose 5-phosphate isomerase A [Staphylococcus sp. IVB6240]UXR73671.1 ribose 5-phosphate isomerase A [Staphylococcus sp. IVB6238]UXR75988.1 ribose 5-phosphate isomerase A [Staphylococcus sp. IVB6233]UXR80185.1 ribose 5-phosphate isomerase A [Staphylococcus sp. IVB6218]